jgi:hypothetical protein
MKLITILRKLLVLLGFFFYVSLTFAQNGFLAPTDGSQKDFLKLYKLVLAVSDKDYRFTNTTMDSLLFPKFGEFSVYRLTSGSNKGSFVFPDTIPAAFSSVTTAPYTNYDWKASAHQSIQFKIRPKTVAIFSSKMLVQNNSINWETPYFKNLFDSYLFNSIYQIIDEDYILNKGFSDSTRLLIIPSFTEKGNDAKGYIDDMLAASPNLKQNIDVFLARGGTIYTEGNAAYLLEKLGYLTAGTVNFGNLYSTPAAQNSMVELTMAKPDAPLAFPAIATGNTMYAITLPQINGYTDNVIAKLVSDNRPVLLAINNVNGGKLVCNLALPTVGGYVDMAKGSHQMEWTLNTIVNSFASPIDVTRAIFNEIPRNVSVGKNGISYEARDTFEVRVTIRNLSAEAINNINVSENIHPYFEFFDVLSGAAYTIDGKKLSFSGINLAANSEKVITYRLLTPKPTDPIHENVDKFLFEKKYIYASANTTSFTDNSGFNQIGKARNYTEIMFGARLWADADVNWKNILYLDYQPFKVFMIMENKERTSAESTQYTQFVPKDVPYYWSDGSINIPILKTPGGKFVQVMKGSNDQANPEYDMDHDGHPDAWLDTATIYPKGYTLTEAEVYWQNPWAHLKGATTPVFEDIDHDGLTAKDLNNDGIVDVEEPGDKIRVWKITWDIKQVPGYQVYDPYCSYELWLDPPDLVPMAKGVAFTQGKVAKDNSMFYPYSADINNPNLADTSWTHWMERDASGKIVYKRLIEQKQNNYEGFAFMDNAYQLKPYDKEIGLVPQPHREFIAVVSLGGEEIDMTHPTPSASMYSKLDYKTIFNEKKTTPIRTTYTYYAPLPNPLQFEYLSNNYVITDTLGKDTLQYLPEWGKAHINFDMDASTEYTYYWIRNVGHDVDYNDPSLKTEGIDKLGDGVFGYFIYEIPKGFGGYKITLPKKQDGSFDLEKIVNVDGKPFAKWLDNPNTKNEVEIWETPFTYQVYVPQILIPAALDDDNFDGIDDWIDDRGDRYLSNTGYLHDAFMMNDGEQYPAGSPNVFPHEDFGYGTVTQGWSAGADKTYGDDHFENLGKTHIKICAIYEGKGKEGPIEISKGGTLVVEEIFGGSPWVIGSHVLSGYAEGVDLKLTSTLSPSILKFGKDTTFIKHTVEDLNEPHQFDGNFDPYLVSYGYGKTTITSYVGGKDPCSLLSPAISMPAIIDPKTDNKTITLVPLATNSGNPDLTGYPKTVSGSFFEVRIEVSNGTDDNWVNTTITPVLSSALKNTELVMSYVAYPRPLVPAQYDVATGKVTPGDQIGSFRAGWRFNQPEAEVLVKMGNTLNMMQPSRRGYFIYLFKVDPTLANGIYAIDFTLRGETVHYDGKNKRSVSYAVPSAHFSISDKNANGNPLNYQKFVIGQASLTDINTTGTNNFKGLQDAKWSLTDVSHTDFAKLTSSLPVSASGNNEKINLSAFKKFPTRDTTQFFVLEKIATNTRSSLDTLITQKEELNYEYKPYGKFVTQDKALAAMPIGPMVEISKRIVSITGKTPIDTTKALSDSTVIIKVAVKFQNIGTDIAQDINATIYSAAGYQAIADSLPANARILNKNIVATIGSMIPGQEKEIFLHFAINASDTGDICLLVHKADVKFSGTLVKKVFNNYDPLPLLAKANDLRIISLSYIRIDDSKIKITAKAMNRGLACQNVRFSLYPVINGVKLETISETNLIEFNKMQEVEISGEYLLATQQGSIDFVAKIDNDEALAEIFEGNNLKKLTLQATDIQDILVEGMKVQTYPNPFTDVVKFTYTLPDKMDKVSLRLYKTDGSEVESQRNCPNLAGENNITLKTAKLNSGTYLYELTLTHNNKETKRTGVIVK